MSNPVEGESVGFTVMKGEEVEQGETSTRLRKFKKAYPKILGAVHVTIGIIMLLAAIVMLSVDVGIEFVSTFYWGIIIYISTGALTIFTDKKLTKAMVCATLIMNILAAVAAVYGSVSHIFAGFVFLFPPCHTYNQQRICIPLSGTEMFMAALSILEFILSIVVVTFAGISLCSCCGKVREDKIQLYPSPEGISVSEKQ